MRPVCRFYESSECTNPRCRFAHPVEYPVYIYTLPGADIHPDELRAGVMRDSAMAAEADAIWVQNYMLFCTLEGDEGGVDIRAHPDYFCMPFDIEKVSSEVERLNQTAERGSRGRGRSTFDNRGRGDGRGDSKFDGRGDNRNDNRFDNRNDNRNDNRFDSRNENKFDNRFDNRGNNRFDSRNNNRDSNRSDNRFSSSSFGTRQNSYAPGEGQSFGSRWSGPKDRRQPGRADEPAGSGWFGKGGARTGRGDAQRQEDPAPQGRWGGSFDRARAPQDPKAAQGSTPEYDYQNVPYHYK